MTRKNKSKCVERKKNTIVKRLFAHFFSKIKLL